METCHYCKFQYHPMPVYTRQGQAPSRINVCHLKVAVDGDGETHIDLTYDECQKKAEEEGYIFRPDLTPGR